MNGREEETNPITLTIQSRDEDTWWYLTHTKKGLTRDLPIHFEYILAKFARLSGSKEHSICNISLELSRFSQSNKGRKHSPLGQESSPLAEEAFFEHSLEASL